MATLIKILDNAKFLSKTILGEVSSPAPQPPTYAIGRSLSAVNEGSSVTFTLSTTNVANGTVLPYTISGISSTDVTTGSLTGSFTVSNGLATATITMSADQLTEGAETATLTLNNAAASNFVVVNDTSAFDSDALAYVTAVQTADGASLENSVRLAINDFVVGCKADGIWSAIKASCILAGARTLNGALVPLVGTAPTNFNFVSADYNRKTGLKPSVVNTKYLNTNRLDNADPLNSKHWAIHVTEARTAGDIYIGAWDGRQTGIYPMHLGWLVACNGAYATRTSLSSTGFLGASRSSGSNFSFKQASNATETITSASSTSARNIHLFTGTPPQYGANCRLAFYSIGENVNLNLLQSRISALISSIQTTIP